LESHKVKLQREQPCFESVCLPGMTEEFRFNMFVHIEQNTPLKMIFITEDNSKEFLEELEGCCVNIFEEFEKNKLSETIIQCEVNQFTKLSKFSFFNKIRSQRSSEYHNQL